jgi:hypothetical protein
MGPNMEVKELYEKLLQAIDDKNRDMVDLLRQEIRAVKVELRQDMEIMKTDILTGVGEVIVDHEHRIMNLEEKSKV